MKTARLQLRIDPTLKERAEVVAAKRDRSLSYLVTQLLTEMVERDEVVVMDEHGVGQI